MDASRINYGEMAAAGCGLALLIFMSTLNWFSVANDPTAVGDLNAWETFSTMDLVLFLVVLVAVGIALARGTGVDLRRLPISPGLIVAIAGLVACGLIVYRLLVTPDIELPYSGVRRSVEEVGGVIDRGVGIYLGLLASVGIVVGGLAGSRERASGQGRRPR